MVWRSAAERSQACRTVVLHPAQIVVGQTLSQVRKAHGMADLPKKYVVVTGTSTGIGHASAAELIAHGYHVFGSVRNEADGERLQAELGPAFAPLVFDVTDSDAVYSAAEAVEDVLGDDNLVGLVNNAGIAVAGPLMDIEMDKVRHQFEVNVLGVLTVTQAFLPLLGACEDASEPPGRIVNISSVSGHTAYPFLGPYCASKHALEAFSDSLRRELLLYGVDVISSRARGCGNAHVEQGRGR